MAVQRNKAGEIQLVKANILPSTILPLGAEVEDTANDQIKVDALLPLLPGLTTPVKAETLPEEAVKTRAARKRRSLTTMEGPAQLSFSDMFVRRRANSLGVADAKSHFSEIIEKLNNGSSPPILVHRYVEPQAAIVGIEDYYVSETLISKLQDYVARTTNRRRSEVGISEMLRFLDEAV